MDYLYFYLKGFIKDVSTSSTFVESVITLFAAGLFCSVIKDV